MLGRHFKQQGFYTPDEPLHGGDIGVAGIGQIEKISIPDPREIFFQRRLSAQHHGHERGQLGLRLFRPFADRCFSLPQRFDVEPGNGQERHAARSGHALRAGYLFHMACPAGVLE